MIIFVNNIPLHILEKPEPAGYTQVIDLKKDVIKFREISGRPLIRNAGHRNILSFMEYLQGNHSSGLTEVFFTVKDERKFRKYLKSAVTAIREVEEECGISVFAERRLVTTWHTYFQKGNLVIKRTKWYSMKLISDAKMAPQTEEGIEELVWMGPKEVAEALKMSYRSIIYVMENYQDKVPAGKVLSGKL